MKIDEAIRTWSKSGWKGRLCRRANINSNGRMCVYFTATPDEIGATDFVLHRLGKPQIPGLYFEYYVSLMADDWVIKNK